MTKTALLCALYLVLSASVAQGATCKFIYWGPLAGQSNSDAQPVSLDGETRTVVTQEDCETLALKELTNSLNETRSTGRIVNSNRLETTTIVVKDLEYIFEVREHIMK
ncbi:MAG: hypothetical protein V1495_08860 [Pseudomonadota bacterium]